MSNPAPQERVSILAVKRLSVKQAADLAGCSQSLIYQLCEEGRIPHYRLGSSAKGKISIAEPDLSDWLESRRVEKGG